MKKVCVECDKKPNKPGYHRNIVKVKSGQTPICYNCRQALKWDGVSRGTKMSDTPEPKRCGAYYSIRTYVWQSNSANQLRYSDAQRQRSLVAAELDAAKCGCKQCQSFRV